MPLSQRQAHSAEYEGAQTRKHEQNHQPTDPTDRSAMRKGSTPIITL